jgi:GxxExxY protein
MIPTPDPAFKLLFREEVYGIVGAAMEVYNHLGPGFLEAVYQEAFEIELTERNIPFISQPELPILYKGKPLKKHYLADLLVYDKIVVEIKAISTLTSCDEGQLLNELKAASLKVGLLINFGSRKGLEWARKVM